VLEGGGLSFREEAFWVRRALGSLKDRDVGQSGFECELALFGAFADAFSTYEHGVADADEPEETRRRKIHRGTRR
jgi:hypothetical protein